MWGPARRASWPAALVAARVRRRPARWLLPALGIAIVAAFGCAVAAEATIAGDRAARDTLRALTPVDRSVRVTGQDTGDAADRQVRGLLAAPGLGPVTKAVLFFPVRLGGTVVRVAAISPLSRWVAPVPPPASARCTASRCELLLAGGVPSASSPAIAGAGLELGARTHLTSAVALGFTPPPAGVVGPGEPPAVPLLLSGDVRGLQALPGLQAVYRTTTWLAVLDLRRLHSWQLASLEAQLQHEQADLLSGNAPLAFVAPFGALDAARAHAAAAPRRLLLAGGGAAAALVAFVLLAASALRRDLAEEIERLRIAGATRGQRALLAAGEAAAVSAGGVLVGGAGGVGLAAALAGGGGEPAGEILTHGLLTATGAGVLVAGWLAVTLLLAGALLAGGAGERRARVGAADVFAVVAVAALALALARGASGASADPLPVLVAPLCCLAAGALMLRLAGAALRGGERVARSGPLALRLAMIDLARAPAGPAGAAAFLTISVALGGFALSYRATMGRSAADQAADRVALDVTVSGGPTFAPPLLLAPLARWRAIAGGAVLPVRRTQATFPSGAASATVPLIAIPGSGLALLHGWRDSDASALRPVLARRLVLAGPVRTPGPALGATARTLAVRAASTLAGVRLTAQLRDGAGDTTALSLGAISAPAHTLHRPLPPGNWELEAFGLDEPTGLAATSGHQNAESATAAARASATVTIGSVTVLDGGGRPLPGVISLAGWRARDGASQARARGSGLRVALTLSGQSGVLRPAQPGDVTALPVLVDNATAAQAGRGGRLPLSVDGVAIAARVVGRLARFPTAAGGGFAVADEAALAARLDADAPGQGRPDELWLAAPRLALTRAALGAPPFTSLSVDYRADIERALRSDAVLTGVSRTLTIAAVVAVLLAAAGLLTTLLGSTRDRAIEHDLAAQGMGPGSLRLDVRLRLLVVAGMGVGAGLLTGLVLARLAVAAVRGSLTQAPPTPALVTVIPWAQLAVLGLVTAGALVVGAWAATARRAGESGR